MNKFTYVLDVFGIGMVYLLHLVLVNGIFISKKCGFCLYKLWNNLENDFIQYKHFSNIGLALMSATTYYNKGQSTSQALQHDKKIMKHSHFCPFFLTGCLSGTSQRLHWLFLDVRPIFAQVLCALGKGSKKGILYGTCHTWVLNMHQEKKYCPC